jgi:hypothetical protein
MQPPRTRKLLNNIFIENACEKAVINKQIIVEKVMKRLLREAADSPDGKAVFITTSEEGYKTAVIYDSALALNPGGTNPIWMKSEAFLGTQLVKGLIAIQPAENPCWGAYEVKISAGPGLGKLVYGVGYAMSPSRILIPDRKLVSDKAREAWGKVYAKPQVKKFHLDNKNVRRTPEPEDDCEVHNPDDPNNPLNYAYKGSGEEMALLGTLKASHQNVLNQIPSENRNNFLEALLIGTGFFWKTHNPYQ